MQMTFISKQEVFDYVKKYKVSVKDALIALARIKSASKSA